VHLRRKGDARTLRSHMFSWLVGYKRRSGFAHKCAALKKFTMQTQLRASAMVEEVLLPHVIKCCDNLLRAAMICRSESTSRTLQT
jgi:hypothetical protein